MYACAPNCHTHLHSSVVMVVGAGRGPLVDATLRASRAAERLVVIYAVEKNPGAVVTYVWELQCKNIPRIIASQFFSYPIRNFVY